MRYVPGHTTMDANRQQLVTLVTQFQSEKLTWVYSSGVRHIDSPDSL